MYWPVLVVVVVVVVMVVVVCEGKIVVVCENVNAGEIWATLGLPPGGAFKFHATRMCVYGLFEP
jgi:hypothetical protein